MTAMAMLFELDRSKIGTTLISLMAVDATKLCWFPSGSQKRGIKMSVMAEFNGRLIERLFPFPSDVWSLRTVVSRFSLEMAFLTPDREFGVLAKSFKIQIKQFW
jgi:hypothetical protein